LSLSLSLFFFNWTNLLKNNMFWQLAERNDLDFNSTFKALESDSFNLTGDYATLYNYIINNQNTTQHAILWLSRTLFEYSISLVFFRLFINTGEYVYILFIQINLMIVNCFDSITYWFASAYLDPFFARGREIPGELGYILFYNSTKEQSYTDQVLHKH
jgi:hypothetical protein